MFNKIQEKTLYIFGIANSFRSMYVHANNGVITDEWQILDDWEAGALFQSMSSTAGESASLVWDSNGCVLGLLWGGKDNRGSPFVTPIEYVRDYVRDEFHTNLVHIKVRTEDGPVYPPGWHRTRIPPVAKTAPAAATNTPLPAGDDTEMGTSSPLSDLGSGALGGDADR